MLGGLTVTAATRAAASEMLEGASKAGKSAAGAKPAMAGDTAAPVGVSAAKALAMAWDVPFVAVNHLEAHLYASLLEDPDLDVRLAAAAARVTASPTSFSAPTGSAP